MQKSTPLVWDDLRFVLALSKAGSLAKAAKVLRVDHTTVGRRIESIEEALGLALFHRTHAGYALTLDGERLLGPMRAVEEAVLSLERAASSQAESLAGTVRLTSPETFGIAYLAPRLSVLGRSYPGLAIELDASGAVLDLHRREADIAVRFFKSQPQSLVVRRVGAVSYGLYATPEYLRSAGERHLRDHRLLAPPPAQATTEGEWLSRITGGAPIAFASDLTLVLLAAALADAGVAVLPRYLGDVEPRLQRLPMAGEPSDPLWLTVHGDLKNTPRVRLVLDFLAESFAKDRELLAGATTPRE